MPRAPKACPRCPNPQPCPDHTPVAWAGKQPWHSRGFPPAVRQQILDRDPTCACPGCGTCGQRCDMPSTEADHKVPVAQGGTHNARNGRGLCAACHASHTAKQAARARWAR